MSPGAAENDDSLYLTLLNKDAHQAVQVHIQIRDWQAKPNIQVHQVTATSYLSENTIQRPDTVRLRPPENYRTGVSGKIRLRLKPNTLTVLRIEGRAS